ncbi:MAG: M1 family metallopeptidase [Robiginitomaculum sp.]|nr:M1 family metallopeptidase [Robiginitomaculum sp.]
MVNFKTFILSAGLALGMAACSQNNNDTVNEQADSGHEDSVPHAQLGDNVIPVSYNLDLRIDPRQDGFSGVVSIVVDIKKPTQKIWLHGQHITVSNGHAVLADGRSVDLTYTEVDLKIAPSGVASLTSTQDLGAGRVTLVLPYETPYNTALNSAYKVSRSTDDGTDNYIVTQFEAIGARQAFPGFDESRFKVPFDLTITSPSQDVVYANTPDTASPAKEAGWTKHVFDTTRPLPTYLIAFGVGPWDVVEYADIPVSEVRDRTVPLRGIAVKGLGKDMQYALKNTAGILETLETYFGIPYPYKKLDLIAAPDYAFGAMENPGAIVYTEYLLLMDENSSLGQRRAYASVNAHELAHQWFGDLVTPVWWEDIWLNEAFATWMGNKTVAAWRPDYKFDRQTLKGALGAMSIDSLASTRKVREPLLRTESVMDQFDGITYRKGGGVLAMFESYLGEDVFQKGVRLHMKRFEDSVATADDFFQSLADGSGNAQVVPALKSFVDQPGLPLVKGSLVCAANSCKVNLSQSRYAPLGSTLTQGQTWQIPVCAHYGAGNVVQKTCTLMTGKTASLTLEGSKKPTWLTLNADGAGYYRFTMDAQAWDDLLANLEQLNTKEVLTVLDSLKASFSAGELNAETYLNGMAAFAKHKEYDVASSAGSAIGSMYNTLLPKSARPDLARFTQTLYAERYQKIKDAKTMEGQLLSPTLAARLISYGGDKALGEKFAKAGANYLGLDGKVDKKALAPNMLGLGLRQTFKKDSKAAMPALMALVKSGTPAEKGRARGALSATLGDKVLTATMLDEALNNTDVFTGRQATGLIYSLVGNPDTQTQAWSWFKENFDGFVKTRVADVRLGGVPGIAGGFCSVEKMTEVETFFTSKAELIPGYERSLAQVLESISLCAALKTEKSTELVSALAQR